MSFGDEDPPSTPIVQVDIGIPIYVYDRFTGTFIHKSFESEVAGMSNNPTTGWTTDAPIHDPAVVHTRFDQNEGKWVYSDFSNRPRPHYDPFVWKFVVADWTLHETYYYLSIPSSAHECGLYPTVIVLRDISTDGGLMYRQENAYPNSMKLGILYVEAGRIILKVPQSVNRFDGIVVIKI